MMSLTATRCVFRTIISEKCLNPVSRNITFMTLRCHRVNLKCLQSNNVTVLKKTSMSFILKQSVSTSTTLRMSKNYYDVLGVPKNASQKQIKDAYYKLAMIHHPDKNQGNLTQKFREIKEAYDVLSNESGRMKYDNNFSNNYSSTSSNWTSNSFQDRYQNSYGEYYQKPDREYTWTNARTQYKRASREHAYDYSYLKPFNVFINVIKVPKNVVKTQIDLMLLTFIKNRTLKLILYQLFQLIWTQVLKNLNFNVLIPSTTPDSSLAEFVKSILGTSTIRIELTELDALKGKAVRLTINDSEKVLVVDIPRGVKRDQSFILFYLVDDDNINSFKI